MVTKLDLFIVRGMLEKIARCNDARKAEAAKSILANGLVLYEYTRIFVEKREKEKAGKQKVAA